MSNETHTPGPGPEFLSGYLNIKDDDGNAIHIVGYLATEENKRLVIAAPDMREALECWQDYSDFYSNGEFIRIDILQKWANRYLEVFQGWTPRPEPTLVCHSEILCLANELRRRAIAKAKGEAE